MHKHALIVDDELGICELISEVCELQNIQSSYLTDATLFTQALGEHPETSLIFLDLNMPNKDGIEVLRELTDIQFQGQLVLMSGFDDGVLSSAYELAIELGLCLMPSITKPFTLQEIRTILETLYSPLANSTTSILAEDICEHSYERVKKWLDNDQLVVHYQPQIHLQKLTLEGVECLVRLIDDDGILIYPNDFINTVETHGLNQVLLEKVVDRFCADYQQNPKCFADLSISINVSALDLDRLSFPDDLWGKIKTTNIQPQNIIVEITESRAIEQMRVGLDILARLRLKGFQLSIDDFGTGRAVLGNIRKLPYNELKIDRSFVDQLTSNPRTLSLTHDLIQMAHHLGLRIVAEGIEDIQTAEVLRQMHCEIGQGYLYAKPMPLAQLAHWIAQHHADKDKPN
ncbi:signal transduction protein [Thiosulfatimonas sediminis]|uniref:Signal transduction protein n=1 Tax=Thiosulfatimonas sediminis TaxID=2675054 RepID=A0A6F8PTK0_9GAMM|nr:EAL domain-containing response regulator [Thiosulfatimonas sediminis]BBP45445.1 signal transduction protein [Thiosulfatimonas sediminis]